MPKPGHKTVLAIYAPEQGPRSPLVQETLEAMAEDFLAVAHMPVDRASFGVAGPVSRGVVQVTNLPWDGDEEKLEAELGLGSAPLVDDLGSRRGAESELSRKENVLSDHIDSPSALQDGRLDLGDMYAESANMRRCEPISASSKARRGKEINDYREGNRADARGTAE